MGAKLLLFDDEARQNIRTGMSKVTDAIRTTLGPHGRSVIIDKGWGAPMITMDGASIADEVELKDPCQNIGAQVIKEAASKTNDQSGDGTTTSAILTEAIYANGLKIVTAGANSAFVCSGIKKAADAVVTKMKSYATPVEVKNRKEIINVAALAAKGDQSVGEMLADAFQKVGKEGAISIEEGKGIQNEITIVEGMQFDRGYLSPHFVTNQDTVEAVLEEPYIFIHEDKLSSVAKLIPLLEKISASRKPLLIIAEDIEGEALATLVVNKLRGIIQCCAVKAPGYGDRRKAMLEDIAILCGGEAVFKDLGIDIEKLDFKKFGRAKKVIVDSENTTIIEGAGSTKDIERRCLAIRKEMEKTDSDYDKEKLQERLAKLSGGVAQIKVGAATETELKEKKQRLDDALHAVRGALEEGIVAGGGVTLLKSAAVLDKLPCVGDEQFGVDIVKKAVEMPLRQIAINSGSDPATVVKKVKAGEKTFGYNAANGKFEDLAAAGILDPFKVVKNALVNASSAASLMLTTNAIIVEDPAAKEEPAMPPGGGGGMGPGMMPPM